MCLMVVLHCRTRIRITTRFRREFPMGTIVPYQMFTSNGFRLRFPSQVQISIPKMGIVAILGTDVRPWGENWKSESSNVNQP